tara:strand:+ start:90 stop:641 length:552 start_codon:yes stop_codon:yes gene_type:complete
MERSYKWLFVEKICKSIHIPNTFNDKGWNEFNKSETKKTYGHIPSFRELFGVIDRKLILEDRLKTIDEGHIEMFVEDNVKDINVNELDVLEYRPKDFDIRSWFHHYMMDNGWDTMLSYNSEEGFMYINRKDKGLEKDMMCYYNVDYKLEDVMDKKNGVVDRVKLRRFRPFYVYSSSSDLSDFM